MAFALLYKPFHAREREEMLKLRGVLFVEHHEKRKKKHKRKELPCGFTAVRLSTT